MTNVSLAQSYLSKARVRLTILPVLFDAAAYSDVIRESQEVVELALKGMLRQAGIEPPHWHDVGGLVKVAFYGDIDFVPTEQYDAAMAKRAMDDAGFVVAIADRVVARPQ